MKKVLFRLQPDLNPGPSNYKAAVLLTELHCQTNKVTKNREIYTQFVILDYFWLVFLYSTSKLQSCNCPSPTYGPMLSQSRPIPVPIRTYKSRESEKGMKIQILLCFTKCIRINLMLDKAVSCGTKQFHEGQSSPMWDRVVSCSTDQSHVGQICVMWDRAVSCGSDQSHVG